MITIEHRRSVIRKALAKRREQLKQRGLCVDCGHAQPAERERYDRKARAFVRVRRTLCQRCLDDRIERNHRARKLAA